MKEDQKISVWGARVHNIKNIDVDLPRNRLIVITGLSGSGKSSLAFDTIYAEGQRRYIETLSAYARKFIGHIERPDVDKITGLSPVIAIEQKTTTKNPRSTVGTITEIYDFLRLLFARAGEAFSYKTGEKMIKYSEDEILRLINERFQNKPVYVLAPVVKGRKGHYRELFEQIRKKGYIYVRVDGVLNELRYGMKVDRYKNHHIEIVVDRLKVSGEEQKRLKESVRTALKLGKGYLMIMDKEKEEVSYFSKALMCPTTGLSYGEPAPHSFSFNSPRGACPECNGLGTVSRIDEQKLVPDESKSIRNGAIEPLGKYKNITIFWQLEAILKKHKASLDTPFQKIPQKAREIIFQGSNQMFRLEETPLGANSNYFLSFDGVISYLNNQFGDLINDALGEQVEKYISQVRCPECNGNRLNKEALHFLIDGRNIAELANMEMDELAEWMEDLPERLNNKQKLIARDILKELNSRIGFLLEVGLSYLSLSRPSASLSGGESQRIRLATQIGSRLVNVLYILDEPSIGLHHKDNQKLIDSLKKLRDAGNSVIVVEHDEDMILSADYVLDIGPGAGKNGGQVVAAGTPEDIIGAGSLTADYLSRRKLIEVPRKRREGQGKVLTIKGASGNNLQNVNVDFPLGKLICVTGVSGSGKSTLINETLYPALSQDIYRSKKEPLAFRKVEGLDLIDKVIDVDQSPIGRTPRSNPATYTGVFSDIRKLFVQVPEAKIRGYKPGRFSFNVSGGRCETCKGAGVQTIEMNFLPDVYVTCKSCNGRRYNKETLDIKYKGHSINDVLNMTINQAVELFSNIPSIYKKMITMQEVGLGYVTLGQPSTTLSGGESQRVKLASELAKKDTGKTMYILDEPTTGLHFEDVRVLLGVLTKLVDKGNTVVVIEHNMEVIKMADHIIDMGPDGGKYGGHIVAQGQPEDILNNGKSYTAQALNIFLT